MKTKKIIARISFILITFLLGCGNRNRPYKNVNFPTHFENGKALVAHLDWLFNQLSELQTDDSGFEENVIFFNEQIKKTMERVKTPKRLLEVNKSYLAKRHDFLFTLSDDVQIGVFSWDSKMGFSTGVVKNMALYVVKNKVIPTTLYGAPLFYNEIHVTSNPKGFPLYLLHGKGTSKDNKSFYQINAYQLNQNGLQLAKVFPSNSSTLTVKQANVGPNDNTLLDFSFEMDGSLIMKPEKWGATTAYRPYQLESQLNRQLYSEAGTQLGYPLDELDFRPNNPFEFLNGSELPLVTKNEEHNTLFIFENELTVELIENPIDQNTIAKVSLNPTKKIEFPFERSVRLYGKKDNLLFFSEEGKSGNWPLHMFDLEKNKLVLTKNVAAALLKEDRLVYLELTEPYNIQNIGEIECNPNYEMEKGYFKAYSFKYSDYNPIVEYTNQLFCGQLDQQNLVSL